MKRLVIDTETTGLSPRFHKTLTVGLLLVDVEKTHLNILNQNHIFIKHNNYSSTKEAMKVNKIDHICIAVKDLEAAKKIWEPLLGKTKPDDAYIDEPEKINVARYWVGEVGFELMESTTPNGDVAKYIEKNGEGIMLLSLNVDNTRESVDELKEKDYPFIPDSKGEVARPFRDCEFSFIHPKKMNGVLTELIDYKWDELKK